jgi:hypothetical protein
MPGGQVKAHGEMISSDLHGAEEPIRWTLGWQRQENLEIKPRDASPRDPREGNKRPLNKKQEGPKKTTNKT